MVQEDGKMIPVQKPQRGRDTQGSQDSPQQAAHASHSTLFSALIIGSERNLFKSGSPARRRISALGATCDELHIICFTLRKDGFAPTDILPNTRVYPTNSASRLMYILDAIRIAARLRGISVISAQDPFESGLAGYLAARRLTVPLQLQIHTDLMSPYFTKYAANRIRLYIARFLLPRAQSLRVVSERIKRSLTPLRLAAPVLVLPICVDLSVYTEVPAGEVRARYPQFNKLVLVVSRLEKEKNVAGAIRAFAQIQGHPGAGLIIVGAGSQEGALRALVRRLGLKDRVVFAGFQKPGPYYKDADVLLNASWYEGYGLTLVEALSLGCPVVSTDVGVAREAGAIVVPHQELDQALARALDTGVRGELVLDLLSQDEWVRQWRQSLEPGR